MPLIKLDAIDSTNDYLKLLSKERDVENYTIVIANEQTKGKGQMGAKWISEPGKNLTMSILVKYVQVNYQNIFILNVAISLAIIDVLDDFNIPDIKIKWPNDIMSGTKKVTGILIENAIKHDGSFNSVIGIGLNLNQTNFDHFPQATSLSCITSNIYEIETTAIIIGKSIEKYFSTLTENQDMYWLKYHENLYKINYPSTFEDKQGNRFMGVIKKVTTDGKLEVLVDDGNMKYFEVKEIKML